MKKSILIIILVVIVLGCGVGIYYYLNRGNEDSLKFKEEYESLNGEANDSNKKYREINIPKNNPFIYATEEEIVEKIDNKETFAVYFGFKSCPWCRSILPTLIDVAKDMKIDKIYYVDVLDIRDTLTVNEKGKVETTKKGSEGYYKILEKLDSVLADYTLKDEKGKEVETKEKRIYAPNVVSIVNGSPKKLTTAISSKQTDGYMELTKEMKEDTYQALKTVLEYLK